MIAFPNCKINLGLRVTEKRNDGFHNVETVLFPLNLSDVLDIVPSTNNKFSLDISGLHISSNGRKNLVEKAYDLLSSTYGIDPVHIHLHKIIPSGAGLGGGSSDAAFTLKLINTIFNLDIKKSKLETLAASLGSDCPFFIQSVPVFAFGRGNQFRKVQISLSGFEIVVVKPTIAVDTTNAYSWITPKKGNKSLKELIQLPPEEWYKHINNDFEEPVFERYPEIGHIKASLIKYGAVYASMSGSGSAVYGIFKKQTVPELDFPGYFIWKERID